MHFKTFSLAAALLAVQPALADFLIFGGASNEAPDPAKALVLYLFNNAPSCIDANNGQVFTPDFYNDASNGGLACDGCTHAIAPQDWDVKRLEVNDNDGQWLADAGDNPHITLYKDDNNGGWGLYDTEMHQVGVCKRPSDIQFLECGSILSVDGLAGIIHCETKITIKDSN